jgi:hypothetical protein
MLFSDWTLVKMGEATWAVEKEDLRINKWWFSMAKRELTTGYGMRPSNSCGLWGLFYGLKLGLKLLKANIVWDLSRGIYESCLKLGVAIGMFIPLVG